MAEGILNINKPSGLTSHDVVDKVRRIVDTRRVGHTGTLDPLATGVLLVCVGRATRLAEYLVGQRKRYRATVRLGQETDTFDSDGQIIAESSITCTSSEINMALDSFRGEIIQQVPSYSAIKIDGEPLYRRARRGEHPERPARLVTVYEMEILEWVSPYLKIDLCCSSGTYIRSIAHDLGQSLGCGGHLAELSRVSIGDFTIQESVHLNDLNSENWQDHLMPMVAAIHHLPRLDVTLEEAVKLYHGQPVLTSDQRNNGEVVQAFDIKSRFVGIAVFDVDHYQAKKIFYEPDL